MKISNWFEQFNTFSQQQTKLYSLSTGYTAEVCDDINFHQVKKNNVDGDKLIVSTTIDMTIAGKNLITVADDTDVLVMLLHFWNSEMGNISNIS